MDKQATFQHREKTQILALFLAAVAIPLLLMIFREADGNTLASWQWLFNGDDVLLVFACGAVAALGALWGARRLPLLRHPATPAAAAFLLSLPFFTAPEMFPDAGRYFVQAKAVTTQGISFFWREWGLDIPAWTDLPLVPFLHGLLAAIFGESRLVSQIFSALCLAGAAACLPPLGRLLHGDEERGVHAAWLLLASPYLLVLVPMTMIDLAATFFLILAVTTFAYALRGGTRPILLAAACLALALISKFSIWLFAPPLLAMVLWLAPPVAPFAVMLRRAILVLALAGTPLLIFLVAKWEVVARQLDLLINYQAPALGRWGEGHASTLLFQIHPFFLLLLLLGAITAAGGGRLKESVYTAVLILGLLILANRIRYLLPLLPVAALGAAGGLQWLSPGPARRFAPLCAAGTAFLVAFFGVLPFLRTTAAANFLEAGRFLDTLPAREAVVYSLSSEHNIINPALALPLLDIHTTKKLIEANASSPVTVPASAATSPLRFTWDYRTPHFYIRQAAGNERPEVLLVVTQTENAPIPSSLQRITAGYRREKSFQLASHAFVLQPTIRIFYDPAPEARPPADSAHKAAADDQVSVMPGYSRKSHDTFLNLGGIQWRG